jgi:hypothetical protein
MNIVSLLVQVAVVYFSKNPVGWQERRFFRSKRWKYFIRLPLFKLIDAPVNLRYFCHNKQLILRLERIPYSFNCGLRDSFSRFVFPLQKWQRLLKNDLLKMWWFNNFLLTTKNPVAWYLFLTFGLITYCLQLRKPQ